MPQVYGKKRSLRTNASRLFADSLILAQEPNSADNCSSKSSELEALPGPVINSIADALEQISIDDGGNDTTVSDTSRNQKNRREMSKTGAREARLALSEFDSNVRKSPRLAQKQTRNADPYSLSGSPVRNKFHCPSASSQPSNHSLATSEKCVSLKSTVRLESSLSAASRRPSITGKYPVASLEGNIEETSNVERQSLLESELQAYVKPLLQLCNDTSGRNAPTCFQSWADRLDEYFDVSKIAEASYGEVYRLALRNQTEGFDKSDESVLKIIALKPSPSIAQRLSAAQTKRVDDMSAVSNVAGEVRLLRRMSPVPGFANFRECRVMQGPLPKQFTSAWKNFNTNIKKSEFPDPGRKESYHDEQLWAVVEMQDAGNDLEDKPIASIQHVWDIFWSTAIALAKGEEWAEFEHRDLHLGNICVKWPRGGADELLGSVDNSKKLGFTGADVTLIDYTLSRATIASEIKDDCAFLDLDEDPDLFEGDSDVDYQYDIYRYMRSAVLYSDPNALHPQKKKGRKQKPGTGRGERTPWRDHHPITNLVWLHFVLYKLTEQLIEWPSSISAKQRRRMVREDHEAAVALEEKIRHIWDILDLEDMKDLWFEQGIASAAGLLEFAVKEGWLDEDDVLGLPNTKHRDHSRDELASEMDRLHISSELSRGRDSDDDEPIRPARRSGRRR